LAERLRGLFVTGTDTGVGKTVLAAAIVAALRARGDAVTALKPVITGLDVPPDPVWPHDHELLACVAGSSADDVAVISYAPPVSPHLAAKLSGRPIDPAWLERRIRAAASSEAITVVEGVGGLLVPLADGYDVRALARRLALPLVIAARPGLGTINHTLLTLEAAGRADLQIAGVVLTPWSRSPDEIACSNRETIERLGGVPVATLPELPGPDPAALAAAGALLPLNDWLAERD
jgi:dethiobiotin synthetase